MPSMDHPNLDAALEKLSSDALCGLVFTTLYEWNFESAACAILTKRGDLIPLTKAASENESDSHNSISEDEPNLLAIHVRRPNKKWSAQERDRRL
jgi:hypothetical protein